MDTTKYNEIKENFGQELLDYINNSPTMFHAVKNAADMLTGFEELSETKRWDLKKGGKYYIKRNKSSLFAFEIGSGDISKNGFSYRWRTYGLSEFQDKTRRLYRNKRRLCEAEHRNLWRRNP